MKYNMLPGAWHSKMNKCLAESDETMRNYIRHPADIPIEIIPEQNTLALSQSVEGEMKIEKMENVSFGGLMFQSSIPYTQNKMVTIKIHSISPDFEAHAAVSWCRKSGRFYLVGVEFTDKDAEFKVRMVEQICHIMEYRKKVFENEGRELDKDEAAKEWIEQHAADFPK